MTMQSLISWAQVRDLRDDVGPEDFEEIVALFLEEVDAAVADLRLSPALEGDLHALKGSALNLGFERFAALCSEGEALSARGAGEQVSLDLLRACYAQSRALFMAERSQQLAA